jgi:hypothetical protein
MTRETDIRGGRLGASPAHEELRRRLLALVLAAVLIWYTVVVPAGAYAKGSAPRAPDDEGRDGEVRGRVGGASADSRAYSIAGVKEGLAFGTAAGEAARESVEDLDWPEYIYPD